jgi:hypothetical protein
MKRDKWIYLGKYEVSETMVGRFSIAENNNSLSAMAKQINKERKRTILFFQKDREIKCVFKNAGGTVGVGIAKCHKQDKFEYLKGTQLSEIRARVDFLKKIVSKELKEKK